VSNLVEDGVEAGTWNKYESRNPVQRLLVWRFLATLRETAAPLARADASALDVGCGEGVTTALLRDAGFTAIRGCDFSAGILEVARKRHPGLPFFQANIYALEPTVHRADFVAACEVLEHLDRPAAGLARLAAICQGHCLLSVPREPIFRALNFCAGKYWRRAGSSPGHLNHWSTRRFVALLRTHFEVVAVRQPLPWTVVLARPR
jgi:2-polyprenyl-3-methyl-5-hydroxy-6-metoxy-1,4-benzoquinol methylase